MIRKATLPIALAVCVQLVLAVLLFGSVAGEASVGRASATRCVEPFPATPPCFSSIQAAINSSAFGDRIDVAAGTYSEHITMTNGVSIYGAGWSSTIIDGRFAVDSQNQATVRIPSGVSASTVLSGVQITRGGPGGTSLPVNGGGIEIQSASPQIVNTWLNNNTALNGGGAYVNGGSPTFNNVRVSGNLAEFGGGFYLINEANVAIAADGQGLNGTVWFNTATDEGGGIYIGANVTATISGLRFNGNEADDGGGVRIANNTSPVTLQSSDILNNIADTDSGGIGVLDSSNVTLLGNDVISNTASLNGGGAKFANSSALIQNNTFARNTATNGSGGGLYATLTSTLSIPGNQFESNSAVNGGGLRFDAESSALVDRNTIISNTATSGAGGGVSLFQSGMVTMTNNIVARNTAPSGSGDGLALNGSLGRVVNNTVAGNLGDGIWFSNANGLALVNNIFSSNSGRGIWLQSTTVYTANYNDVFGNTVANYDGLSAGANDLSVNPLFVGTGSSLFGYYHLQGTSPVSTTGSVAWAPDQDIDQDFRKLGGYASMGADEFGLASGKVYLPVILRNYP